MEVKWIEYKSKKILYVSYDGCKNNDDLFKILNETVEYEKNAPDKILEINVMTNMYATKEFLDEAKRVGKEVSSKKVRKNAFVGIVGIKKILFNAYSLFTKENIHAFDTEEKALNWLVE